MNNTKGVFIVAEIGKNFIQTPDDRSVEEYLQNAKELVRAAKEAGADAVKFQTHHLEDEQINIPVTSPHFTGQDRYHWIQRNALATSVEKFWIPIKDFCKKIGINFFSTPMSRGAAQKLNRVGIPIWKVGSADILDFVMLDYLASTGKPIIISTGMSTLEEVDCAVDFLKRRGVEFSILHCVSRYPCPQEDLMLETIPFLRDRYGVKIGFSDHSLGSNAVLTSVIPYGAEIIEKHFSFSRELWGADHKVSTLPHEFKSMVIDIRNMEDNIMSRDSVLSHHSFFSKQNIGKTLQTEEADFRYFFRKSLVAASNIQKGTVITPNMVFAMRPQGVIGGMPSEKYEEILERKLKINLLKYEPFQENVFQ